MDVSLGEEPRGPLAGIRVLDLSTIVSGPLCAQILGDMGADVTKIEPLIGDTTRRMGPPFVAELTPLYAQVNRNKRNVAIDLKSDEGRDVARRLASQADVLIENYRPEVASRLGLSYADLAKDNPNLIYVSINGFGPDGPYADLPAYDTVIQGISGYMPIQGREHGPLLVKSIVADKTTSLTAAYATMGALFARERGAGGQHVQIPMLDAYAAFMMADNLGGESFPPAEPLPFDPPDIHRTWETKDGHVVMMIIEDHQFQGICRAIDRADMIDDPRCENLITRIMNSDTLFPMLEEACKKLTTAELVARAREHGAPLAPANDLEAFLEDPQVKHNKTVFEVEHPEAGTIRFLRNPVRYEKTPASLRRLPAKLGEHSDQVLSEAGFAAADIAKLRESGTVG